MKHLLSLLIMTTLTLLSRAQSGKISGVIQEGSSSQPISGATVSLLKSSDSAQIKQAFSDKAGNFQIADLSNGNYLLRVTAVGHEAIFKAVSISAEHPTVAVGNLALPVQNKNLSAVVVTSKRPFIERKIDRTVVNVDAAISNEGTTALDVLEKSPGVSVDKDGNISLKGKPGVTIMLDGKPAYLTGQELVNLLQSMPSSTLDQIEIMTNPSSKYDAAGNSGLINIKTKKNKQRGFNGNLGLNYGQGVYGKTNGNLNLNYRNGKFNVFTNLVGNYREHFQVLDIQRRYKNPDGSLDAIFEQSGRMMRHNNYHGGKIGVDYYASKKTTIGVVVSGFIAPSAQNGLNTSYLKDANGLLDSIVQADRSEKSDWNNGAMNLNFRHQYDTTGRELTADIDYLSYNSTRTQVFGNSSFTPNWNPKFNDVLTGDLPSVLHIYSAKADYTMPLKKGMKLETGIKSSYVETDNTAGYFNIVNGVESPDYEKTNRFVYKENINAAYVNFNRQLKKWSMQLGLRMENTNMDGHQFGNVQRSDSAFKRSYTNLFPTLFVNYAASDKHEFTFNYGRRINRPDYGALNPFLFFIDKYTYDAGNPFLRPSYAHTFELSHSFNHWLTTSVNYANTKDLFNEIFEQKEYATIVRKGNFGRSQNLSFSVNAQIPVQKWLQTMVYTEYNMRTYTGLVNGEYLDVKGGNFVLNVNNQFKFPKGWGAEISGFYRSRGIEGQIIIKPMGQFNLGVQKQVIKNKGTIKLNVRDLFYTMNPNGYINFQRTEASFQQKRDSRVVTLGFSYRFGKPFKAVEKRKTGGAGSEESRVNSGN